VNGCGINAAFLAHGRFDATATAALSTIGEMDQEDGKTGRFEDCSEAVIGARGAEDCPIGRGVDVTGGGASTRPAS
jgi:hypothetical protein